MLSTPPPSTNTNNTIPKCQQPIEIDRDDPFKHDALNRKESITILSTFIQSFNQSIVLCVDAPWGQGKTTFLKMWQQYLENKHIPTIYFNAWENDFTDDALVALIGEVGLLINTLSNKNKPKAKKIYNNIKKHSLPLMRKLTPSSIEMLLATITSSPKIASLAGTIAKEQITIYEKSKQSLKEFKKHLAEFASSFTTKKNPKPLIFIIDELDRCRPNFAIEILEKAKHLFNVDNIIFILATDKTQLGHSIKVLYGHDFDVQGYLRRFIDFDYLLPTPTDPHLFVDNLFNKYNFRSQLGENDNFKRLQEIFSEMITIYHFTLREQEHFFSILNIVVRSTKNLTSLKCLLLCFLITLKIKNLELYKNLIDKNNKDSYSEATEYINNQIFTKIDSTSIFNLGYLEAMLILYKKCSFFIYHDHNQIKKETDTEIGIYANKYHISEEKKTAIANNIITLIQYYHSEGEANLLYSLKKSIEISTNFIN